MSWWKKKPEPEPKAEYTLDLNEQQLDAFVAVMGMSVQIVDDNRAIDGIMSLFTHVMEQADIDPEWAMNSDDGLGATCKHAWLAMGKVKMKHTMPGIFKVLDTKKQGS